MKFRAFLDSFSGAVADLTPRERTFNNVLRVLSRSPRVSTWDMSEHAWVRNLIGDLKTRGLIVELEEPYPWHRYALTEAGRAALTPNATSTTTEPV